jgi:predicted nucleotidyltransferase
MPSSSEILGLLEKNNGKIKQFGVKKIGLFGSAVRDELKDDSDLDILVEFKSGKKNFDNYMDLKLYLEDIFNRRVDLVINETIKPSLRPFIVNGVKYAAGI